MDNKIQLDEIARTSLGSLSTRAHHNDPEALKICAEINPLISNPMNLNHQPVMQRTLIYDGFVLKYLERFPDATILNIGCGFCSRFTRVDNGKVTWIDMDVYDIGALRKRLYPDFDRRYFIPHDLNNPFNVRHDLLIAEGVLCYLDESRAKEIVRSSPHAIFDVIAHTRTIKLGKDQKWKFHEKNWADINLRFKNKYDGPERESWVFEYINVLHHSKPKTDGNLLGARSS